MQEDLGIIAAREEQGPRPVVQATSADNQPSRGAAETEVSLDLAVPPLL